jgi:hypothetical protein
LAPGILSKDLETITLKCLQKEPSKGYQSARDLADELRRFLAGQTILARPIGRAERSWRWIRRHRIVATLTTLLVAALLAGTTVSTLFAIRSNRIAGEYALKRNAAQHNLELAERNLGMTQDAVEEYLTKIASDERLKSKNLYALRTQLLETALPFYERFAQQRPGDANLEAEASQRRNWPKSTRSFVEFHNHSTSTNKLRTF